MAYTVVDLETTGATPGFSKITEIGAVRLEGGREVGSFSALVDPGVPIPPMITGITGIDDATVAGAGTTRRRGSGHTLHLRLRPSSTLAASPPARGPAGTGPCTRASVRTRR